MTVADLKILVYVVNETPRSLFNEISMLTLMSKYKIGDIELSGIKIKFKSR